MLIETQTTPDADVINFFPAQQILKKGSAEFVDAKSLRKSPLAEKIFDLGGIKSLFLTTDMISVTKNPEASWDDLKPLILAEIMDFFAMGEEAVITGSEGSRGTEEIIAEITGLINARIRPAVRQDGGDIVFRSFDNGVVYVELQGSCKGCPYAMVTLKEGVEKILKTYIPEVKSVENYDKEG